jgi:hypothetical protein
LDRKLADVEMVGGKLHVVSYDGEWVNRFIEDLRPHVFTMIPQTDQELYDSLPERLQGMTWASLPDERRRGRKCPDLTGAQEGFEPPTPSLRTSGVSKRKTTSS